MPALGGKKCLPIMYQEWRGDAHPRQHPISFSVNGDRCKADTSSLPLNSVHTLTSVTESLLIKFAVSSGSGAGGCPPPLQIWFIVEGKTYTSNHQHAGNKVVLSNYL